MGRKIFNGIAAGALIGVAAGMLIIPQMDKRTRRKFARTGKRAVDFTTGLWSGITDMKR